MATLPTLRIKSKIEILYFPDTAKEKSQRGETISIGPLLPSATGANSNFHAALRHGVDTMRRFMLKKNARLNMAKWLDRKTVYEGKLMSMTGRVVRLFAPDPTAEKPHVDISYDWVIPVR